MTISRRGLLGLGAAGAAGLAVPRAAAAAAAVHVSAVVSGGNTDALLKALAEVELGATVVATRGVYDLPPGGLAIRRQVRLAGEGAGTVLRARGGSRVVVDAVDVVLEDLAIEASLTVRESGARITGCHLHPVAGPALVLALRAHDTSVEACAISGASGDEAHGVEINRARGCLIHGCRIHEVGGAGISVRGGGAHVLAGNVMTDCLRGAVVLEAAREVSVTSNTFSGGAVGIAARGGRRPAEALVLCANVGADMAGSGIDLSDCVSASVSDNQIRGAGADGIRLDRCNDCSVTANVAEGCGDAGLKLVGCETVTCIGNICTSNGGRAPAGRAAGIAVTAGEYVVLAGNVCDDPLPAPVQAAGIEVSGDPVHVLAPYNILRGYGRGRIDTIGASDEADSLLFAPPWRRLRVSVGRQRAAVPHGLGHLPTSVTLQMTSPGRIWQDVGADGTNLYLRADGEGRTADVTVG